MRVWAIVLITLLLPLSAGAEPQGTGPAMMGQRGGGARGPGGPLLRAPLDRLVALLDLSGEQKASLEKIRATYRDRTEPDWAQVEAKQAKLRALWSGPDIPKKSEVLELQGMLHGHRTQIAEATVDARIAALETLTQEQRAQLAQWREQNARRRGRGKMGPGGQGQMGPGGQGQMGPGGKGPMGSGGKGPMGPGGEESTKPSSPGN